MSDSISIQVVQSTILEDPEEVVRDTFRWRGEYGKFSDGISHVLFHARPPRLANVLASVIVDLCDMGEFEFTDDERVGDEDHTMSLIAAARDIVEFWKHIDGEK